MIIQSRIPPLVLTQQPKTQKFYIYCHSQQFIHLLINYSCSSNYMSQSHNTNIKNS